MNVKNRSQRWKTELQDDIRRSLSQTLDAVAERGGDGAGKLQVKDVLALQKSFFTPHLAFGELFPKGPIR